MRTELVSDFYEIEEAVYLPTNAFLSFSHHEAGNLYFHQAALLLSSLGIVHQTQLVSPMTTWVWRVGSGVQDGFWAAMGKPKPLPSFQSVLQPHKDCVV